MIPGVGFCHKATQHSNLLSILEELCGRRGRLTFHYGGSKGGSLYVCVGRRGGSRHVVELNQSEPLPGALNLEVTGHRGTAQHPHQSPALTTSCMRTGYPDPFGSYLCSESENPGAL